MEKLLIGLIISFILLLVCINMLSFAWADQYGVLGIRHADNPMVCVFEPDPMYTDDVEGVVNAAYTAVSLWQEGLFEHSPDGNWRFLVTTIPLEDHKYKDARQFPACSVLISFEYINDQSRSLGYTYLDFSKSSHKYTHITLFLRDLQVTHHYDFNFGELEQEFVKTTIEIKPFSMIAIQNITTHELGHALGLGHYKITDYPIYTADQPWINASIMYYAINPAHDDIAKPRYVDIKMVEKIYGEDGFGGMTTQPIKMGYYTAGDTEICTHKCTISRFI